MTGPVIENGTVVITNGKIAAVGANASVPSGASVIDGKGLSVYPGMIDADTEIGLTEIGSVAGSVDTSEIGDNNANIHVDVAINTDSSHIAVTRVNGVTTALTAPRGGLIAGQSALLNLDGWTPREMVLKSPVAMHLNWPGGGGRGRGEFGGFGQQRWHGRRALRYALQGAAQSGGGRRQPVDQGQERELCRCERLQQRDHHCDLGNHRTDRRDGRGGDLEPQENPDMDQRRIGPL